MPSTFEDLIDGISTSTAIKAPCRVVTSANITLSGLQTIDGVALAAGDRVLVKEQTAAADNGIWVAATSTWQRAKDWDGNRDVVQGTRVLVTSGTGAGEYHVTTANPIIIGTTSVAFERSSIAGDDANLDVFLVIGQSNAGGRGDKTDAPITVPTGKCLRWYAGGSVADANDPIQPGETQTLAANFTNGGSAWPAFCLAYYAATGRKVGVIMSAKGGSAQVAAADSGYGNYDTSGLLYDAALAAVTDGLAAFTAAGHTATLKGIIIVNGETDALAINDTTITGSDYITASQTMLANFRTDLAIPQLPVYYVRTGVYAEGNDSGFFTIRAAQETIAAADPYTHVVYRNAVDANWRGLYGSGTHMNQDGYNEMGAISAINVVTGGALNGVQRDGANVYYSDGALIIRSNTNAKSALGSLKTGTTQYGAATDGSNVWDILEAVGVAAPIFLGRRAKGTMANKTGVVSGDVLAIFGGEGYDSTGAYPDATTAPYGSFVVLSSETWSGTARGTKLGLYATPAGTTSLTLVGTITPSLNTTSAAPELGGVLSSQYNGDTNNSSSGSGSDYTHDLTYTVPANYLNAGRALKVTAAFRAVTGSSAPTLITKCKLGSTVVADCEATTLGNNITTRVWHVTWLIQPTSAPGASGTVIASAGAALNAPIAGTVCNTVSQPVTLATNGDLVLSVATRWGSAGTGTNTIQLLALLVEK